MKNAHLWKMVLNGGLQFGGFPDNGESLSIIKSPIITFAAPERVDGQRFPYDEWTGQPLSVPFNQFWMECGPFEDDGSYAGALVKRDKDVVWITTVCADWLSGAAVMVGNENRFALDDKSVVQFVIPDCGPGWRKGNIEFNHEILAYAMNTLILLSCKNVSLSPKDNDPKQVRRAIKRHGGTTDSYRYHVLTVRPAGSKPGTPGQEIGTMPRHVCRGHFSEYGPEFGKGLLFGKYSGRFYVPPCVKGKRENGVVEKDYALAAPSVVV